MILTKREKYSKCSRLRVTLSRSSWQWMARKDFAAVKALDFYIDSKDINKLGYENCRSSAAQNSSNLVWRSDTMPPISTTKKENRRTRCESEHQCCLAAGELKSRYTRRSILFKERYPYFQASHPFRKAVSWFQCSFGCVNNQVSGPLDTSKAAWPFEISYFSRFQVTECSTTVMLKNIRGRRFPTSEVAS